MMMGNWLLHAILLNAREIRGNYMLTTLKNNKSLTYYQQAPLPISKLSSTYAGGISSAGVAHTSYMTTNTTQQLQSQILHIEAHSKAIVASYEDIPNQILKAVGNHGANTECSKAGYLAEGLHTGTYNLDATIKGMDTRAEVLADKGPVDIIYDGGKQVQAKYTVRSAKAQLDPKYIGQEKLIPSDQLKSGREELAKLAHKNYMKGRVNAAHHQQAVKDELTDKLISADGQVTSTPTTKVQAEKIASSIHKDADGNTVFETHKELSSVLKQTGDLKKKNIAIKKNDSSISKNKNSIIRNELKGIGLAVAIGIGVGATIGVAVTLAQSGITPDTLKLAAMEGGKAGLEAGVLSAVTYGVGHTICTVVNQVAIGALENLGISITEKISSMVNMGVVGGISLAVFSTYQFIKLKLNGIATQEAIFRVGHQALCSLSLLVITMIAQGALGGVAGMIVSVSVGIIYISYSVGKSIHDRKFSEKIRIYTIEKCRPSFALL